MRHQGICIFVLAIMTLAPQFSGAEEGFSSGNRTDLGFDWSHISLSEADDKFFKEQGRFIEDMKQSLDRLDVADHKELNALPSWKDLIDYNDRAIDFRDLDVDKTPSALQEISDRLIKEGALGKYVPVTSINGYGVGLGLGIKDGRYIIRIVVTERTDGLDLPSPTRRRYTRSSSGIE